MFSADAFRRCCLAAGAVFSAVALAGLVGCGKSDSFDKLPVKGKITYEDGSLIPAARIRLRFSPLTPPIDQKIYPRPGTAEVNVADGTFSSATTSDYGDGLVVGRHTVRATSFDKDDQETELQITPAEIEVGRGKTEFQFKAKRP
jgi:major membrane immunogen (membrane-anchored lipoprotein)